MQGFRLSLSLCAAAGLCAISIAGVTNALAQAGGVPWMPAWDRVRARVLELVR